MEMFFDLGPEPEWPCKCNWAGLTGFIEQGCEMREGEYKPKPLYPATLKEIGEAIGIDWRAVDYVFKSGMKKIRRNLMLYLEIRRRLLAGEDEMDIDVDEILENTDLSKLRESVLYSGETTNFLHQGSSEWAFIKYLLQM